MYNYHQELIKNSRNNSVEPSNKKQVQQQKKFNIKFNKFKFFEIEYNSIFTTKNTEKFIFDNI